MAALKAAVIGGGIVGGSWAIVYARAGLPVAVHEADEDRRAAIAGRIETALARSAALLAPGDDVATVMRRITLAATPGEALAGAGFVHECIEEKLDAKRALFARLNNEAEPEAILATTTSSFPVSVIADDLACRDRCIVVHPAAPPHLMPVTEICPAPFTRQEVTDETFRLMERCGQVPVLIRKEIPGFVMNRLQAALVIAMLRCVGEGSISPGDVDKIISAGFGLRWAFLGPFEGVDLNAPGGIREYFERYGFIFNAAARELGLTGDVVTPQAIDELDAYARGQLPLARIPDRTAWRDEAIAALTVLRRGLPPSA
jgi:3-hydroxyacyl-CoA dehydrogenase